MDCPIVFEKNKMTLTRSITKDDFGFVSPYETNALDYFFNDNPDGWEFVHKEFKSSAEFKIRFRFFDVIENYIKENDLVQYAGGILTIYKTELKQVKKASLYLPLKSDAEIEKNKEKLIKMGKEKEKEVFKKAIADISKVLNNIQTLINGR